MLEILASMNEVSPAGNLTWGAPWGSLNGRANLHVLLAVLWIYM